MNNTVDILFPSLKFRRPDISLFSGRKGEGRKKPIAKNLWIFKVRNVGERTKYRTVQSRYYDEQNFSKYLIRRLTE
jgi:hypothetical protein